jgi:hypothetical protein
MNKKNSKSSRINIKDGKVYIDDKLQNSIDGKTCEIIYQDKKLSYRPFYFKDKDFVYFVEECKGEQKARVRKLTADILHFKIITDDGMLSKDQTHLYVWGRLLENVDGATFELIPSHNFAKDKNHVYYYARYWPNFVQLPHADPNSFFAFQNKRGYSQFGSDKDNLYHRFASSNDLKWGSKKPVYRDGVMLQTAFDKSGEVADFILRNKNMKGYWWSTDYQKKPQDCKTLKKFHYSKSDTAVYTKNMDSDTPELINGADPKTFQPITEQFSKDKNHVFYYGYQIKMVDPKTVRILENDPYSTFKYISDAKHVFCIVTENYKLYSADYEFYSFEIVGADPKTFKIIDDDWTEDKNNVYKRGVVHKAGKPGKPVVVKLNDRFSKDDKYAYWDGKAIRKSDTETFEILFEDDPESWAKDSINLYNANAHRVVKGVDGKTFSMLDRVYGRDKENIFSFISGRPLSSIDTETFEVIPETGLGKDKNNFFFMGKKIGSNKYEELSGKLIPLTSNLKSLKKKREELWSDLL